MQLCDICARKVALLPFRGTKKAVFLTFFKGKNAQKRHPDFQIDRKLLQKWQWNSARWPESFSTKKIG